MKIDQVSQRLLTDHPFDDGQVPSNDLISLLNQLQDACSRLYGNGTTAQRPRDPVLYQQYFDTTLGDWIYCSAIRIETPPTPAVWMDCPCGGGGTPNYILAETSDIISDEAGILVLVE